MKKTTLTKKTTAKRSEQLSTQVVIESLRAQAEPTIVSLERTQIKDKASYEKAVQLLIGLKQLSKEADMKRCEITDPLNQALKATNKLFKPFIDRIAAIEKSTKQEMVAYIEREEKKSKAIEDKFHSGAIKKIETVKTKQQAHDTSTRDVSVRITTALKIVDANKIPRALMIPNENLILAALRSGETVAGCELEEVKTLAI